MFDCLLVIVIVIVDAIVIVVIIVIILFVCLFVGIVIVNVMAIIIIIIVDAVDDALGLLLFCCYCHVICLHCSLMVSYVVVSDCYCMCVVGYFILFFVTLLSVFVIL